MRVSPTEHAAQAAYDTVIVGGGTAGCVLASRLSEDADCSVLVLEAGPSGVGVPQLEDAAGWAGLMGGCFDWKHVYAGSAGTGGRSVPLPRGRVLGGSSAINAMLWYRGHPSDYDSWDQAGATGWDHAGVLPYFRRSEDWEGGANRWRGAGGPMRIERSADLHPIAAAMLEAAPGLGIPVIADANGASNEGACLADLNMRAGRRWSAARGYLHSVLARPNLAVCADVEVLRLVFERGRCTGVVHRSADGTATTTVARREVILCAGAVASPVLLLRSGVGPAAELRRLGVPVVADLPGVGANLQDHPLLMGINFATARPLGELRDNGGGAMMNWRSRTELPGPDLHAFVKQGRQGSLADAGHADDECFAVTPGLMRARSRGYLRLHGTGSGDVIELQPNFLQEEADVEALVDAVRTCIALAASPAYAAWRPRLVSPVGRMDAADLTSFVRARCSTFFHTAGTCRMGDDTGAVVDPSLRVRGIDGLRVVDASVMPTLPSCNTQAPVIMIAERASDLVRGLPLMREAA